MKDVELVVISGPSGAGKRTAIKALEDTGFFCVDNLPVPMLPAFMDIVIGGGAAKKAAMVVDVREGIFLKEIIEALQTIREAGYKATLLYLEAADDILVRRFSETRRAHPLAAGESPLEGLVMERRLLKELKFNADKIIDTSAYNVHQLRNIIREYCAGPINRSKLTINLVSFGFRYGVPTDADLVFDVRFIPNPFFVTELRTLNGTDAKVRDYVLALPEAGGFLERVRGLLDFLVPLYWQEGKTYLTVAVGCTGGKHRSVAIAEAIAGTLTTDISTLRQRHRDIDKL